MKWLHLQKRANSESEQLFIRGTRIKASVVYFTMVANNLTVDQVAEEKGISVDAADEAVRYSVANRSLIEREARATSKNLKRIGQSVGKQI